MVYVTALKKNDEEAKEMSSHIETTYSDERATAHRHKSSF